MKLSSHAWLVLCGAFIVAACFAPQKSDAAEAYYRCKDAKGQPHFGTSMPPECQGFDTDVLNDRGIVMRVVEGAVTHAKRLEREAAEAAELKKHNDQLQRDKVLIDTYLSVEEIERLRDQRLDLLNAQLKVAEQHIATLNDRLQRLREQTARFKPYSDKPNAPQVPDHLAEDLIGTVKSIAVDQQTMNIKRDEQATLTANFEHDIKRFRELKGIK